VRGYASFVTAFLVLAATLPAAFSSGLYRSTLEPPASGGLILIDRSLAKLSGHRRMLIVGAHPDDEDNALLAYVSQGLGGDVAYLSLSRGEGGQNLIGTELGTELGVIRTGELLAARALEDGRQYFTRAYDFGYTRSLDETFSRWPREMLQRDAVRVARRFKPQVVVAVFSTSERARHGQHQASAVIAEDLFSLSGNADAFPELSGEGLEPWEPTVLYRRSWGLQEATLSYELGKLSPITGRSLGQLAAASRSMHRSQDMGRVQRIGRHRGGLVWLAGGKGTAATSVFDGVDTRLPAIAAPIADSSLRQRLEEIMRKVEALAKGTRQRLSPVNLAEVVEPVARMVNLLEHAREVADLSGSLAVQDLVAEKQHFAMTALAAAAAVVVDARVDRETIPLGGSARLEAEVWSPGTATVKVRQVEVISDAGWMVGELEEEKDAGDETGVRRWSASVDVPPDAALDVPYFLERPLRGDLYSWDGQPAHVLGEPFAPSPLVVVFDLEVAGAVMRVEREAVFRYGDQAFGEIRRPVRAVPPVEIELKSTSLLWRRGEAKEANIGIVVRSNLEKPIVGEIEIDAPEGWTIAGDLGFRLEQSLGSVARSLQLTPEGTPLAGRYEFRVRAKLGDLSIDGSFPVLEYPHVRPRVAPRPARLEVTVFDLELPEIGRVGYVLGASDRIPAVLDSLGISMSVLSNDDLRLGDLDQFDAIVVGSRAYETDDELQSSNPRLLEYVRQGGTLIVQYQQYQFVEGGYAPFPLEIDRPHGRVTDETAPVRLLEAEDTILNRPNVIGSADWDGWVQERGLYFPHSWHQSYRPILAMRDPGREEELGALLVTRYGEGTYIYTGLSFFRQLPAGVPGAIRLFANLLAVGQEGVL
jgi:LmbE family N-acetylglucosaminyl deacetylase